MYDLRDNKIVDLKNAKCLKANTTYKFRDETIGKYFISKFISDYEDNEDFYLISEFRKLASLSGEPEIATVYYLAKSNLLKNNCYTMEFVDGQSLGVFLNETKSIIFEIVFNILSSIASGLEKAHNYSIYHNDLHNENIMIDKFGYVKIIDFLWFDKKNKQDNISKDLEDFKRICNELYDVCRIEDKNRFEIIKNYCSKITTFRGLKKELELLEQLSFEISLLDDDSEMILEKLIRVMENEYNLKTCVECTNNKIPTRFIRELTEKEVKWKKKDKEPRIKNTSGVQRADIEYKDTLLISIREKIQEKLEIKLLYLKQMNILDFEIWIDNIGEKFEGPYQLNYRFLFTSKFFKWKRTLELMPILKKSDKTLESLVIEN